MSSCRLEHYCDIAENIPNSRVETQKETSDFIVCHVHHLDLIVNNRVYDKPSFLAY